MPFFYVFRLLFFSKRMNRIIDRLEIEGDLNKKAVRAFLIGLIFYLIWPVLVLAYFIHSGKTDVIGLIFGITASIVLFSAGMHLIITRTLIPSVYPAVESTIINIRPVQARLQFGKHNCGNVITFKYVWKDGKTYESKSGGFKNKEVENIAVGDRFYAFVDPENPKNALIFIPNVSEKFVLRKSNLTIGRP